MGIWVILLYESKSMMELESEINGRLVELLKRVGVDP